MVILSHMVVSCGNVTDGALIYIPHMVRPELSLCTTVRAPVRVFHLALYPSSWRCKCLLARDKVYLHIRSVLIHLLAFQGQSFSLLEGVTINSFLCLRAPN